MAPVMKQTLDVAKIDIFKRSDTTISDFITVADGIIQEHNKCFLSGDIETDELDKLIAEDMLKLLRALKNTSGWKIITRFIFKQFINNQYIFNSEKTCVTKNKKTPGVLLKNTTEFNAYVFLSMYVHEKRQLFYAILFDKKVGARTRHDMNAFIDSIHPTPYSLIGKNDTDFNRLCVSYDYLLN